MQDFVDRLLLESETFLSSTCRAQGLMQGPDAMAMHALAAAQQHAGNEAHPPIHDMDFEKERKEKR